MIPLEAITRARATLAGVAVRTPLVRLRLDDSPAEIYLKLECLQPIGSFKIRGAINAMAEAPPGALAQGVVTASAGNMAQGVAWGARERGLPCTVVVPDHAPQTKLDAIERLGGRVLPVPFEDWWRAIETSEHPGVEGYFVHPVLDDGVMAGNGTIGLEILEDLPDVDAVLVPWGGGGLTCGIASALRQQKPGTRVIAVEPETGAPLTASLPGRRVAGGRLHGVVRRRLGQPRAAAEDVGPRAGARGRRRLGLARADRRRRAPAGRARARGRRGRRARSPWPRRERATAAPARSSASSRAATSTPRAWSRSWTARRPPDRRYHQAPGTI